jgi:hypothetical protein
MIASSQHQGESKQQHRKYKEANSFIMRVIASLIASAGLVAAHGYVDNGTIGGQYYQFYQPYQDPYINPAPQRIERAIPGNGPVEDVSSIDVQCNGYSAGGVVGSKPAALHADAAAGSTVTLFWTQWPDSHVGPIITYMARCPDTGCQNWQPASSKVWFKVQEEGRQGTSNTWASVRGPYVTLVLFLACVITDFPQTDCHHEGRELWCQVHHP